MRPQTITRRNNLEPAYRDARAVERAAVRLAELLDAITLKRQPAMQADTRQAIGQGIAQMREYLARIEHSIGAGDD